MSFNKIAWGLLSRYGNEWYALVGRFKPDDLGLILLAVLLVATRATFALLAFGFLFLFGSLATRPQETKGAECVSWLRIPRSSGNLPRKHLPRNTFDDRHDMSCI